MTSFAYKARDKDGLAINGIVEANNELAVVSNLRKLGYSVVSIEKHIATRKYIKDMINRFRRISPQEIIFFVRQLSAMVKSGLPITTSLSSIAQQLKNEEFKKAVERVVEDVEGGGTLSDALGQHPRIFSELFVSMVRVGETAGILDQVLDRVVALKTQDYEARMQLRSALLYPTILVVAAIIIVNYLMIKIVPKFMVVFESYDAALPLATQILLMASGLFKQLWLIIFIAGIAFTLWLRNYISNEEGRYRFHFFLLNIPFLGEFYLKVIVSRFTRTLGALIKSGVPILTALRVTEKTVNNIVISRMISSISIAVTEGQALTEPFKASGIFPDMVIQMISAGEKSGKIDQMLEEVASYYEQETQYAIKNTITALEPLLLLVMGGMVAFIALSVLLPIFNLIKVFRGGI